MSSGTSERSPLATPGWLLATVLLHAVALAVPYSIVGFTFAVPFPALATEFGPFFLAGFLFYPILLFGTNRTLAPEPYALRVAVCWLAYAQAIGGAIALAAIRFGWENAWSIGQVEYPLYALMTAAIGWWIYRDALRRSRSWPHRELSQQ